MQERKQKKGAINCSRTRKEKAATQAAEYNKAHKQVRQSVRKDRRTYIENLVAQAEEAANMSNMKDLYDTTKTLAQEMLDKQANRLKTKMERS